MPSWPHFLRRNDHHRTATELYGRLVAQSRAPWFYSDLGVPDTPEGRCEMVMLHVVLAIRRLAAAGEAGAPIARALTETFVTDMDDCLREMGVGDMAVAKKVKRTAAALYDRNRDYGAALGPTGQGQGEGEGAAGYGRRSASQAGARGDPHDDSRQEGRDDAALTDLLAAHVLAQPDCTRQNQTWQAQALTSYVGGAVDALSRIEHSAILSGAIELPTPASLPAAGSTTGTHQHGTSR